MLLTISINHKGRQPGTLGWLCDNASHISISSTPKGRRTAWLRDKVNHDLIHLGMVDPYDLGSNDPDRGRFVPSLRRGDVVARSATELHLTDAAWAAIQILQSIAQKHVDEEDLENLPLEIKVTLV
jgi:hypothetical protein